MSEMSDVDVNRIAGLLHIVEACAAHSGKLTSISGKALGELLTINEQIRQDAISARKEAEAEIAARQAQEPEENHNQPNPVRRV